MIPSMIWKKASSVLTCACTALMSFLCPGGSIGDSTPLTADAAATSVGGAVAFAAPQGPNQTDPIPQGESDWWAYCVVTRTCIASAEANNRMGCPSTYRIVAYTSPATMRCPSRPCVYSCEVNLPSGLCDFAWTSDCIDTTLLQSPGLCGNGIRGACSYTTHWFPNTSVIECRSTGLCYSTGQTINCGVAHSCATVD
jgi:hypothetical protein